MTTPSTHAPIRVGFISLGCAKNLVDSQVMAGNLVKGDLALAPTPEEADVVIVNTCAFIEEAREESIDSILAACELKHTEGVRAVLVAGCMPQRYRGELSESLPEVDGFIGLDELDRVTEIVRRLDKGETHIHEVSQRSHRLFDPGRHAIVFSGGPYAYLKIAEGCNHACAFCAIPGIRGQHRSRPVHNIVQEARARLDAGYRELNIISQDVTFYGQDLPEKPRLCDLVRALGALPGEFWIRLLYGYPSGITDELLDAMAEVPQVCAYLDIPLQHSHPDMLRAMLRADTLDAVPDMVSRIRARLPDAVLRTTCLVGFPGETEAHVDHLLKFVEASSFDHLGVFTFSPEEDTPAINLPDRPSREEAEARRDAIMLAQHAVVNRKASALVGTQTRALLERPLEEDPTLWLARSPRYAPEVDGNLLVRGIPADTQPGTFIDVRYTAQAGYDMEATVAG